MGVFRTTNPQEFTAVDGIVIAETAPAPGIRGIGTGTAILVGRFSKGPINELVEPGSQARLQEIFGNTLSGYQALVNKRFSRLKIIRVDGVDPVKASLTITNVGQGMDVITFTAKEAGLDGNNIEVQSMLGDAGAGNTTYTVRRGDVVETYENVDDDSAKDAIEMRFAESVLVDVTSVNQQTPLHRDPFESLAGGADMMPTDDHYEAAIAVAAAEGAGNVLFIDEYNDSRNGYLKAHAAETQDKMVICAGLEDQTVEDAITKVADLRDTAGRIIYAYNWLRTSINGVNTFVSPASFMASIISQSSANVDPAYAQNSQFLYGVNGIKNEPSRADFIQLADNGIASFEFDSDIGYKIKSGVVTQTADTSKILILRRRMADFLTNSIGRFLKIYQNAPNTAGVREAAKSAILDFIRRQEDLGVLPNDDQVDDGRASIVDIATPNTNETIAAGEFFIDYRQRIFSSVRYIILRAEIGTSVVVTEGDG